MGSCCSVHEVSCGGRRMVDDREYDYREDNDFRYGDSRGRVMLRGSSEFVSMYSQQGRKGINQDAMTVWEEFNGDNDTLFCGVFDGHGPLGHKVSQYVRDHLPSKLCASIKMSQQQQKKVSKDHAHNKWNMSLPLWEGTFLRSFNEMDEDVARVINVDSFFSGTTAVTVLKQGEQLIIGNLGDSRAVLCTKDKDKLIPVQLTVDLKPDIPSEASRIQRCEGRVFAATEEPEVYRIYMPDEDCPGLAMSRAFGDFCIKDYGLISAPQVFHRKLTKQDEFVVLATDGVWDVLSNNEVMEIVASAPRRSIAAKMLVKYAVQVWRSKYPNAKVDDCAAICLFFKEQPVLSNSPSSLIDNNKHHYQRKPLHPGSKPTRFDDTESSIIELKEEWEALEGLSRANSISKFPRLSNDLNKRQPSQYLEGVEAHI